METNLPSSDEPQRAQVAWWQFVGLLALTFVIGLGVGYLIWGQSQQAQLADAKATAVAASQNSADANPQQTHRYDVSVDDDPAIGPADAPITIIEFSDFECPYCKKWHDEVFPQIQAQYGDQVRLVYRDYPLFGLHNNAAPAAEAANCAGEQNKYWDFHTLLFNGKNALNRQTYETYATQLDLNLDSFKACLDDRRFQQEVEADYQSAQEIGVSSTPTFFINGLALVGAQPYEVFQRVIDMELAGQIP